MSATQGHVAVRTGEPMRVRATHVGSVSITDVNFEGPDVTLFGSPDELRVFAGAILSAADVIEARQAEAAATPLDLAVPT